MGIVIKLLFASLVGRLGVRGRLTEDCDVVWGRASHPHRRQGFLSGPVHPVGACQHVEVRPVSPIGWGRLVVNGPDNSPRQQLHAPTSSARIAACIPMPNRSHHPHGHRRLRLPLQLVQRGLQPLRRRLLRITMRGGDWRVCMGSESLVEVPEGCLGNVGPRFAATVLFEERFSVDVGSRGRRCGAGQVHELQGPTCTHQSSGNAIAPPIGLNLWTRDDNE
jgi:hypothetical protein